MKQLSSNLRQAFASNPSRFLTVASPRPVIVSPSPAENRFLREVATAPSTDAETSHLARRLHGLNLSGMAGAASQLNFDCSADENLFEQRLLFLIEAEAARRSKGRLARRLRNAKLRYEASIADVDYGAVRGFDDALFHWLATGQWIAERQNAIIDGPTGVGKTWLACALGDKACRDGRSVLYERVPQLMADLAALRDRPQYAHRIRVLHSVELLILDDWGTEPFTAAQRIDMFEILDRRCGQRSTLIASQHGVENWPRIIGETTSSTVLLDRIIHNAQRLHLEGKSLREHPMPNRQG
jgi:DNA replication protein DnaC